MCFPRLRLIGLLDPAMLTGQPGPEPGHALGQSLLADNGFRLPTFLLTLSQPVTFDGVLLRHLRFLKRQFETALFVRSLDLAHEVYQTGRHPCCDLRIRRFDRWQCLRIAQPGADLFGLLASPPGG